MGELMSQAFRFGWGSWARRAAGTVPRLHLGMLIISCIFISSVMITSMIAVLRLLLIHWLDARVRGLTPITHRWSYGLATTRYLPRPVKPWLLLGTRCTGKKSSVTEQSRTQTLPMRVSFSFRRLCLSKI